MTFSVIAAVSLSALSPTAVTSQVSGVEDNLIDALARCLDITDPAQRLVCSDAAGRRLVDASRRKEVVLVDQDQIRKTRRSLFGFTLPKINLFGRDGPDAAQEEIDEFEGKITGVTPLGYGKYALTIDGSARWTTTEAWTRDPLPTVGAVLKIKRSAFGGYFVKVGNARAVRAMRVG